MSKGIDSRLQVPQEKYLTRLPEKKSVWAQPGMLRQREKSNISKIKEITEGRRRAK